MLIGCLRREGTPTPARRLPTLGTWLWVLSQAVGGAIKTPDGFQQG